MLSVAGYRISVGRVVLFVEHLGAAQRGDVSACYLRCPAAWYDGQSRAPEQLQRSLSHLLHRLSPPGYFIDSFFTLADKLHLFTALKLARLE